jgi:beta-1,2-mannobiose phosphorylase / 1,2-beta-oligomannan phosphorylase
MAMTRVASAMSGLKNDFIVFGPGDVDLSRSPLRNGIDEETFILGAFNPGFTRLPNGNLLLMVRVAEALREQVQKDHVLSLRWHDGRYIIDRFPRTGVNTADPRTLLLLNQTYPSLILTSLSWLLPVELAPDGSRIEAIHYDRAIGPERSYQCYGVEDPRISRIGDGWYMTTCSVSPERHCTTLHTSDNAIDWRFEGIVLDHQNKDMLLFEGKVLGRFMALTRPMGHIYFAWPPESEHSPGPSIQLATSPDALHWKPHDAVGIRPRAGSATSMKVGGGAPPILTDKGWLVLWHGVGPGGDVGVYRTFHALLDRDDPGLILELDDSKPVLQARPEISRHLDPLRYLHNIVFTTGIVEDGEDYLLASGEDDLACRITRISKATFT